MVVLGLFCCTQAFSRCGAWASEFSLRRISYPETQAQSLWRMCLVSSWYVESTWTRDGTHVPCIGRSILIATREVLFYFLIPHLLCHFTCVKYYIL